ncbi:MAG: LysR family transcriptional regulator [Pseudomonadales bacterium]|nr:LysR family transcriptional regulator [Pseudomonadales bacterium]
MQTSNWLANMQVFVSVVDCGSFSQSARRLGLSQPSVSRQVNALEQHLGVRLLQRTTRRLSLTEAGLLYYDKARAIQRSVIEANQAVSGFNDSPTGLLKVAAPMTWTEAKIAPHLGEFLRLYPDIKIDIRCNDSIQDMVEDQLDLVIRVGHAADSSYIAVPFAPVSLVLCASSAYLRDKGHPQTLSDLHNHAYVAYDKYSHLNFKHKTKLHEISMNTVVRSNSVKLLIDMVDQDVGIGLLPDLLIQPQLKSETFVPILPDYDVSIKNLQVEQMFAMYSSRQQMPSKVRAFIDFYRNKLQP